MKINLNNTELEVLAYWHEEQERISASNREYGEAERHNKRRLAFTDSVIEQETDDEDDGDGSCRGIELTTDIHIRQIYPLAEDEDEEENEDQREFEARVGVALLGTRNMREEDFLACCYDPFHEKFNDNYVTGKGNTEERALIALKKNIRKIVHTEWKF